MIQYRMLDEPVGQMQERQSACVNREFLTGERVHAEGVKIATLMLVKFASAILAVACAYAVLRVAFGG